MRPTGFRWWCSVPGLSTAAMISNRKMRFRSDRVATSSAPRAPRTTTACQPASPTRPLSPSSALALSTRSWSTRASHRGVRCDPALDGTLDGKTKRAHRAREVCPHDLLGALEIPVADRVGDEAMLFQDRRDPLLVHHQFTIHPHLTITQR